MATLISQIIDERGRKFGRCGINYAAYPATCSAMRAQRNLGFHLSASFLCRKPQFNEPLAYSP